MGAAVSDRGTTRSVISMAHAKGLRERGVISHINWKQPGDRCEVMVFGKSEAQEKVVATIDGRGLLSTVAVVENLEAPLIADTDFTRHGIVIFEDDTAIIGIRNGELIFRGQRNPSATEGTADQLWLLDLDHLLDQPAPRILGKGEKAMTAEDVLAVLQGSRAPPTQPSFAGTAKLRFPAAGVRQARLAVKNFNNMAPRTLSNTLQVGAWSNIPADFDVRILEEIAQRRDNPAFLAAHDRQEHRVGSGVDTTEPGRRCSFDVQGQWPQATFGATFFGAFVDAATGWGMGAGMSTKKAMAAALGVYMSTMISHGLTVKEAVCDCASEVGQGFADQATEAFHQLRRQWFEEVATTMQLKIIKMAPEQQQRNFVERYVQTWKRDAACALISQANLSVKHWPLVLCDAIQRRNCLVCSKHPTMTPHERITGRPPDFKQMTRFSFGALASCPRMVPDKGLLTTNFEIVAVVGCPPDGHGDFAVLRQGSTRPCIRSDLKAVNEWELDRPEADWNKLKGVFDSDGRVRGFVSGTEEDFTMDQLMRDFDRRNLSSPTPESEHAKQLQLQPVVAGRITADGTFSSTSPRERRVGTLRSSTLQEAASPPHPVAVVAPTHWNPRSAPATDPDELIILPTPPNVTEMESSSSSTVAETEATGDEADLSGQGGGKEDDDNPGYERADFAGTLTEQHLHDALIPSFTDTFGYAPTRGGDLEWIATTRQILGRAPTRAELLASTRGISQGVYSLPQGGEDEETARTCFATTGRLPTAADWRDADLRAAAGGFPYYVSKVRVVRTADNPSANQIERCPDLQSKWGPSIRRLIDRGIEQGFHRWLTDEEVASGQWKFLDPIWVHTTKDNGEQKTRLAPHGGQEADSTFAPHSLSASCPSMDAIKYTLAVAAYHDMRTVVSDVKDAHPKHNRLDDPACINSRNVAVWLTAFQAGSDRPRALGFLSITNGLRDAGNVFGTIATRTLLRAGFKRSSADPELFHQQRGDQGLSLVVKQVDDILKVFSRDAEGDAMETDLLAAEKDAQWTMTGHALDEAPSEEGVEFCGIRVRKYDHQGQTGLALSQQRQLARLDKLVAEEAAEGRQSSNVHPVWSPVPPTWNAVASAACPERAQQEPFARTMGALQWMSHTAMQSPASSILSGKTGNPSVMDRNFQHQLLHYHTGPAREVELHFARGPLTADRRVVLEQHGYVDVGDCRAPDGSLQKAWGIKLGPAGFATGCYSWRSTKTKMATTVPAGELEALNDVLKYLMKWRMASEEIAGLRDDPRLTATRLTDSAPPTWLATSRDVVTDGQWRDGGVWGCPVRAAWHRRFVGVPAPPSVIHCDNQAVTNAAIRGVGPSTKVRGLTGQLRELLNLHNHVERGLILPIETASEDNIVDALSKLPRSNVSHWKGLEGLMGPSPKLTRLLAEITQRFGRQRGPQNGNAADGTDDGIASSVEGTTGTADRPPTWYSEVFSAAPEQQQADGESKHADSDQQYLRIAPFLATGKDVAARVLKRMGFKGRLGRLESGIDVPPSITSRPPGTAGIGFAGGATTSEGSERSTPDPEIDLEAWARLVVSNTHANSGASTVAQLRRDWSDETGEALRLRWCSDHADVTFADVERARALQRVAQRTLDRRADRQARQPEGAADTTLGHGAAPWQAQAQGYQQQLSGGVCEPWGEQQGRQRQPGVWFGEQRQEQQAPLRGTTWRSNGPRQRSGQGHGQQRQRKARKWQNKHHLSGM